MQESKNDANNICSRSVASRARHCRVDCALVVAVAPLRFTSAIAQRTTPTTITAAVIGVTVSIWPAIVAKDKSFFEEEGLRLDLVTSGASARSIQQVGAGVAHIGSSSMVDTVRAIDAGADVKIFINSLAVGTHSLIAAKNIKSIKDLKGKRVMTGGQRDITNLWWIAAAKHHGLDPSKDVELLFSGSTGNRMSALFAGGVEATVLSTPQSFKAIEDGWTDLGPVAPYLGEFPMMIWHVNTDWAKANQRALVGFAKAHNKAVTIHDRSGTPAGGIRNAGEGLEVQLGRRPQDLGPLRQDRRLHFGWNCCVGDASSCHGDAFGDRRHQVAG